MSRVNGELQNPDFPGEVARAWIVPDDPEAAAALGVWLVEACDAHPLWNYHVVVLVHLRVAPGLPAPVIASPGATHELLVMALDPDHDYTVDPADISTFQWMNPPDVVEQFAARDDDHAVSIATEAVRKCVNGELVPDSDYRSLWRHFVQRMLQAPPGDEHPPVR